jgi:hypothetical protein
MFCDILLAYLAFTCAVAGWNIGLVNCWPLPFAFIMATVITQAIYINFSAWVIEQLKMPDEPAVFLAYFCIWLFMELICVAALKIMIPIPTRHRPILIEKLFGAGLGFAKMAALIVFATLASLCATDMPCPPHYSLSSVWMAVTCQHSRLIRASENIAAILPTKVDTFVVSTRAPTYQPHFVEASADNDPRVSGVRDLMHALRGLEAEI